MPMTYSQLELGEGGHVDDTDSLFAAFHFCCNNVKPVRLVESLTLVQRQQIYTHKKFVIYIYIFWMKSY